MVQHSSIDHTGVTGVGVGDASAHISDATDAHDASAISVLDTGGNFTATDVEAALAELAGSSGGIADQGDFTYLDATEAAAPSTPASGFVRIYAKTDGRIYSKDDAGTEYGPFDAAGGGGGGPMLLADDITASADVDEFTGATLTGWTTGGSPSASAITTEPYDATCIDLTLASQGDRIYKTCPAGDFTAYLSFHGITNSGANPNQALGGMIGLAFTDNAGTGTGMSLYDDNGGYMWGLSSHVYASSGSGFYGSAWNTIIPAAATSWPIVYRLEKVGTTITGGISFNGGATYKTATRTDSTTFTRMGITRMFSSGGTNPTIRIGRFNTA